MEMAHHLTSRVRRPLMVATAVAVLAAGSVLEIALNASAQPTGVCGQSFNVNTGGGHAEWTLSCSGGRITMSGKVKDTDADGRCAYVKGVFSSTIVERSRGACPKGNEKSFSWTHTGSLANGYLYVS
jgi:hypothetical protein